MWGMHPTIDIAKHLGHGITKNSVISKAHRLGLRRLAMSTRHPIPKLACPKGHTAGRTKRGFCLECDRERKRGPQAQRRVFLNNFRPSSAPKKVKHMDSPEPDFLKLIKITELNSFTCHWPVGDPSDLDTFRYCGLQKSPWDGPYCSHHLQKSMKSFEAVFSCSP